MREEKGEDCIQARARFPAGLIQPQGCYRFGLDALLLAGFALRVHSEIMAKRSKNAPYSLKMAEVGCGCGAALLACAMSLPGRFLGIDHDENLVAAALRNRDSLGFGNEVSFCGANIFQKGFFRQFPDWAGQCDMVLANPPWRRENAGAPPKDSRRKNALCAGKSTLAAFCGRASGFLRAKGAFCCIIPPGLLCEFHDKAREADLGIRSILPVASHAGENARAILALCKKNVSCEPAILPPLAVHEPAGDNGQNPRWTLAAVEFCPWLAGGRSPSV